MSDAIAFHPIADIFPMIEGDEFGRLVADIREHGLRVPIVLHHDNRILDGRNRYLAALEAGVEPRFETWDGIGLASDFVWSLNGPRRHLQGGALQIAAGQLAITREAEAKARQGTRTDLTPVPIGTEVEFGRSREHAAATTGVSERSVARAVSVIKTGIPELVELVRSDEVALAPAADIARLPPEQQRTGIQHLHTGEVEWFTPATILDAARSVLGHFDLDPASNATAQQTVQATTYYTKGTDGLSVPWSGRVWLNPPYARGMCNQFVDKLVSHIADGSVTDAILLVHNRTDTAWFHQAAQASASACFTRGRIRFVPIDGVAEAPVGGSVFLYFGADGARFAEVFRNIGWVARSADVDVAA